MLVRIRNDNGFDECPSCAHVKTNTCTFCDEADQYEPNEFGSDEPEFKALRNRELIFA